MTAALSLGQHTTRVGAPRDEVLHLGVIAASRVRQVLLIGPARPVGLDRWGAA